MRKTVLIAAVLLASVACRADVPVKVSSEAGGVRIAFTLEKLTDVEVAIVDAKGAVIRHLAAGMVGLEKAAEPLAPGKLEQSILWDRNDDWGRPVAAACKVRLRTGMAVRFGRTLGGGPYMIGDPRGIALDADGNIYVYNQSYRTGGGKSAGPRYIQVYSRDGKYLRTIMPYSSELGAEAVAPFGLLDTPGVVTPQNREGVWPQVYDLEDIHLHTQTTRAGRLMLVTPTGVKFIDSRGVPVNNFEAIPLWPADKPRFRNDRYDGPIFFALSGDGRRLYIAGPYASGRQSEALQKAWPTGQVYVLDLAKPEGAQPFVKIDFDRNRDEEVPPAMRGMGRPAHGPVHGVATDAAGNVYVCDRANDRVAVFSADGKPVGQLKVAGPHLVAVHDSEAIYVVTVRPLAYRTWEAKLWRFDGLEAKSQPVTLDLPESAGRPTLALDVSDKGDVAWLTNVDGGKVWRVGRNDGRLAVLGELPISEDADFWGADRIAVDYETDDVYVNNGWSDMARFNGITGKGEVIGDARNLRGVWERDTNQRTNLTATDASIGPDGVVYVRNGPRYSGPITRWDRELKPLPVAATQTHVFAKYIYSRYGAGYGERGLTVLPDGRVYVISMYNWAKYFVHAFTVDGDPIDSGRLAGEVRAYSNPEDRTPVTSGLIGPLTSGCGGLQVDSRGNIYVGMQLFPDGYEPPAPFAGDGAYRGLSGSVFKFTPAGGGLTSAASGEKGIKVGRQIVAGAVDVYPDYGPFSGRFGSQCACRNPRFAVDPFDRLLIPNAVRYSVSVRDNAGNEILRFGRYGNSDQTAIGDDVALGWPIAVGVSREHVYVSDMLNRRVVRTDVSFATTTTAQVPADPPAAFPLDAKLLVRSLAGRNALPDAQALGMLRTIGPKAMAEIQAAWADKDADHHMLKLAASMILADAARQSAVVLAPALDQPQLWEKVQLALMRETDLPTATDARIHTALLSRQVENFPADQAEELIAAWMADEQRLVRLASLWAVKRDDLKAVAIPLCKETLKDKDERVRALAGIVLFDFGYTEGMGEILTGSISKDAWVLDMTRPVVNEMLVMDGGPKELKLPLDAEQVTAAMRLLEDDYNNMRGIAPAILMFCDDPRIGPALAKRLAVEEISFVRKRMMRALSANRWRDGVKPLLEDVGGGAGDRKKGTGWLAAECLADIGDPDAVAPLIAMLDSADSQKMALFALGRSFDARIDTSADYRLVPEGEKLARVPTAEVKDWAKVKAAWTAWWKTHAADYKWDPKRHTLRGGK